MSKPTYEELEKHVKELEKTEGGLISTKSMYEDLEETSQDLIWRCDPEGRFTFLNKAWERTLGYHQDEMIGHIFHEFQNEEVIKRDRKEFESLLDGGSVSGNETIYLSKAGDEVNLVFNAIPLKNADGNIVGIQGTAYDVTERKKIEQELILERNKLKSIFDTMEDCVYIVNADHVIEYINLALEREFGSIDGRKCFDFFHDRKEVCPWCKNPEVLKGNNVHWELYSPKNKKYYDLHDTPLKNPDGTISKLEILRDITDRKKVEDALRESEELHRITLSNISDAVFITKHDGTFTFICPNVDIIFGYSEQEVQNLGNIKNLLGDNIYNKNELKTSRELTNIERAIIDKAGTEHHLLVNVKSVDIKEGAVLYTCHDITDRKRAEDELLKYAVLFSELNDLAYICDDKGNIQFINKVFEGMTNSKVDDFLGKSFASLFEGEELEKAIEGYSRTLKGENAKFELRFKDTDVLCEYRNIPLKNEKNDIIGVMGTARDITERREAEIRLQVSEKRFRAIFEQAAVGFAEIVSTTGEFMRVNKKYCEITEFSKEELLSTTIQNITPPGDLQEDLDNMKKMLGGRITEFTMEKRYIRKDESIVWVNLTVSPMWKPGEKPSSHIAVIEDITGKKLTENALSERIKELNGLYGLGNLSDQIDDPELFIKEFLNEVVPASMQFPEEVKAEIVFDSKKYKNRSERFRKYLSQDIAVGGQKRGRLKIGYVKDLPFIEDFEQKLIDAYAGRLGKIIERIESKKALQKAYDELEHRVMGRTKELLDANIKLQSEINERKKVEEKLLQSESDLRRAQEVAHIGSWHLDLVKNELRWSDETYRIFGILNDKSGNTYDKFLEIVHPDDREYVNRMWMAVVNDNAPYDIEHRIIVDENIRWVRESLEVEFNDKGEAIKGVGITHDITEKKQAEEEDKERQLQLIQTQKLAALGEVVAGIAHEINNPNSFISFNVPLLVETWELFKPIIHNFSKENPEALLDGFKVEKLYDEMQTMLSSVKTGSERINRIVSSLKEYSQHSDPVFTKKVNLNEVVSKAMIIVGAPVLKRVGKIIMDIQDDIDLISGDFQKLEQVITNLIVNAANAIHEKKSGILNIRTRTIKRINALLIEIEDNGSGIEPDIIDRITEPFFTSRRSEGGTGLGLSISLNIIKDHSGKLVILTKLGKGSCFSVYLPLDPTKEIFVSQSILCVDDDELVLKSFKSYFSNLESGWFEGTNNPITVLEHLESHPEIYVVLSDIQMPGLNGWELLEKIRNKYPLKTVILYSGHPGEYNELDTRSIKPDFFIQKPFKLENLKNRISSIKRPIL